MTTPQPGPAIEIGPIPREQDAALVQYARDLGCRVKVERDTRERTLLVHVIPTRRVTVRISELAIEEATTPTDLMIDAARGAELAEEDALVGATPARVYNLLRAWCASRDDGAEIGEWLGVKLIECAPRITPKP